MTRRRIIFEKQNLHLVLPSRTIQKLANLQIDLRAETMTEVIRRAVDIAEVVIREYEAGGALTIQTANGEMERIHIL